MAGALILDVGGVLIETPRRDARGAWERAHGLEDGALDAILVQAIGPGWEGGRSEAEIEARLCAACGIERRACERLGRAPEDCLFVDDRQANVEGAEAVGLDAIRFVSSEATIPVVLERLGAGRELRRRLSS